MKCRKFLIKFFIIFYFLFSQSNAFEIIRDTELEQFTDDIVSELRDAIGNYKEIMSSPELPPLLTGLEAEIRCPRCPWKKSCYRQAELNGEI